MKQPGLSAAIIVVAAGLVAAVLYPQPLWQPAATQEVGAFGSAHVHASLFFLVDGDRKPLSPAFIEQDPKAHFHADDAIIHVEATNVDLDYVLTALNTTVNETCIGFGPDNTTACTEPGQEIRVLINGNHTPLHQARNHIIRQDDTITFYHGDEDAPVPDRYRHRVLPDQYRTNTPGQPV